MYITGKIRISLHLYRLYGYILGNVTKKDLNLKQVILNNFEGSKKLIELLDLVESEKVSHINGKLIAYIIIDGDNKSPLLIAEE
jgi:transcriptional regulator of NAD metabolism